MKLPIPKFGTVVNCVRSLEDVAMVVTDPNAGREERYSVVRLTYKTGRVVCEGRELPWGLAKKVAKREPLPKNIHCRIPLRRRA
jgi:hypothetical protein